MEQAGLRIVALLPNQALCTGFSGFPFFPLYFAGLFTFEQYPLQYVSATTDVAMNDFGDVLRHIFPYRSPSMVIYTLSEP